MRTDLGVTDFTEQAAWQIRSPWGSTLKFCKPVLGSLPRGIEYCCHIFGKKKELLLSFLDIVLDLSCTLNVKGGSPFEFLAHVFCGGHPFS